MNNEPEPKYPCIESTVEFVAGTYEVRAWINETEVKDEYDNSAFKATAKACAHLPLGEFAKCLAAQPRVNAVHIKDIVTGDGIVPYVNWP